MDELPAQLRNIFVSLIIVMLTSSIIGHYVVDVAHPSPFCAPCPPLAIGTQSTSLVPDSSQTHLLHAGFIMTETTEITLILGLMFTLTSNLLPEPIQVFPPPNRPPILIANSI